MANTLGLLATKLDVPQIRDNLVSRPRLLDSLRAATKARLTRITAPAGSGKTTLLAEWCTLSQARTSPTAWVSLDEGDSDPLRFWAHLIAALDPHVPGAAALRFAGSQLGRARRSAGNDPSWAALRSSIDRVMSRVRTRRMNGHAC